MRSIRPARAACPYHVRRQGRPSGMTFPVMPTNIGIHGLADRSSEKAVDTDLRRRDNVVAPVREEMAGRTARSVAGASRLERAHEENARPCPPPPPANSISVEFAPGGDDVYAPH